MELPRFLLADSTQLPDEMFVLHTEYPRFLINLVNDEIEWFDDLDEEEEEEELVNLVAHLVAEANKFYENELEQYEKEDL
ncbi:MAG: hypothetical protein ACI8RY_000912 [Urechidicola sp.]|jgi:hypothetical protein|tara:strand:+ start:1423 stop:1662 length:240 start_codon:yes stop_codon:yes gene_type:complete